MYHAFEGRFIINLLARWFNKRKSYRIHYNIIPFEQHGFENTAICQFALKVLQRLNAAGYQAFLVGGGVRDLILNQTPKDFDVATNATPEQIKTLFKNCRLIGRRFRLAHVFFNRHTIIEVATFRSSPSKQPLKKDTLIWHDNQYGTLEEDAHRRDFTVNALYYNPIDASITDFQTGWTDLDAKQIRIIGDPQRRYEEDPVRMLRAIRFAAKLNFSIESDTAAPILPLSQKLLEVPAARLFEEYLKLFQNGHAQRSLALLRQYQIFSILFPAVNSALDNEPKTYLFILNCLMNTDQRVQSGQSTAAAFLLAAFYWQPVSKKAKFYLKESSYLDAWARAAQTIFSEQNKIMRIPKRIIFTIREIWAIQKRLEKPRPTKLEATLMMPRFRAAYNFLMLRSASGDVDPKLAAWWKNFQKASLEERKKIRNNFRHD